MMKKSYVWALLASMFMVGCSQNDDLPENPGEDQKVEKEWSYMAINVNAAPSAGSRAGDVTDGGFVAGDATESTVTNACFFFFKDNGDAFTVNGAGENNYVPGNGTDNSAGPGPSGSNWVTYTYNQTAAGSGTANVEKTLPVVLTLSGINNSYPTKMVAVLNWTPPTETASYTLTQLKDVLLENYLNDEKFIMSSSVYKSNGTPSENVYATQLTQRNFAKSPTDAKNNPVEIYVERVAAKVTVGIDNTKVTTETAQFDGTSVTAIKIGATDGSGFLSLSDLANLDVYAKIDGWDLNTTINKSYLLKNIEGNATYPQFDWNKPAYFRSYWATIPTVTETDYTKEFTYDGIINGLNTSDYCLENTSQDNTTKVIVKATIGELVEEGGNKEFKPLPLAYWMGTYYRVDNLKKVVANLLSKELYYKKDGDVNWKNIDATETDGVTTTMPGSNYIGMTTMTGEGNSYKVIFNYNSEAPQEGIEWSFDKETEKTVEEVNAKLNALAPAQVWENGQTYYVVPIKHATVSSGALYGVIRNHVYQINITGVVGLGTPVFGNIGNIEEPLVPMETDTYLAARINVLSWKVVSNDVTLGEK